MELSQKSKFRAWKIVKIAVFEHLILPNLISRKICVLVKFISTLCRDQKLLFSSNAKHLYPGLSWPNKTLIDFFSIFLANLSLVLWVLSQSITFPFLWSIQLCIANAFLMEIVLKVSSSSSQCGNLKIFRSHKFYVKSIMANSPLCI